MRRLIGFLVPVIIFSCAFGGIFLSAPMRTEVKASPMEERTIDPDRPDYAIEPEIAINAGDSLAAIPASIHLASAYFSRDGKMHVVGILENRSDDDCTGVKVIVVIRGSDGKLLERKDANSFFQLWPAHTMLPFEAVFRIALQEGVQVEIDTIFQDIAGGVIATKTRDLVVYKLSKHCTNTGDGKCTIGGALVNDSGHLVTHAQIVVAAYHASAIYIGEKTLSDIAPGEERPFSISVYLPAGKTERDFGVYVISEGEKFNLDDFLPGGN